MTCSCPDENRECHKAEYLDGSSTHFLQVIPNRNVSDANFLQGLIQFYIDVPEGQYWDPRRSFMQILVGVDNWAGGAVDDDFTWSKNAGACLFQSMSILHKGQEVCSITQNLALADTLYKRMTYRQGSPYDYTTEGQDNAVLFDKDQPVNGGANVINTKFCWKLPIIEDMGYIPPGSYTIQLNPHPDFATRVVKLPHNTSSAVIDFTAAGSTHSCRVQIKDLKYWVHMTTLPCGAKPVKKDVLIPLTRTTIYDLYNPSGNVRITAQQMASHIAFGFVDSRRNTDARIETTDLKFYRPEDSNVIPGVEQSHFIDEFAAEVRSIVKPNPRFKLYDPNSDIQERDLYMYSRGSRNKRLTMESFNKFESDGSYILMRYPLVENSSEQGSVSYKFHTGSTVGVDGVDITNAQLIVFELADTIFHFGLDANSCALIVRE